ncbi:glutathione-disulfide reductase [Cyanobium sp. Morenito 9A2]|uniref:glutathione-disulfide reductase n=1 Tax=Cyanobium sp. Morenito 9A2 TaxID=2823718 RepID=UPI0020CFDF75|nr:glutathione-disulfide reductase [Cyanobium sp. Morenito 9A2]MCP9850072.1 glutathione-disulfide reductase [Cyanobium sp. Morenito 9A2]
MAERWDLVVIGAGSGGLAAAKRAAAHGARVALIEGDRVGGTCVIRGCVPKKLLVYGSAYRETLANATSFGWELGDVRCKPATLLANVRAEVDRLDGLHVGLLVKAGVELMRGWARFESPHELLVTSAEGEQRIDANRVLIAVGGRPVRPAIPGAELAWVSDDLFLQDDLPASVLIVGGGYIACEVACILVGLGVAVTQLVRRDHLLAGFDRELSDAVQAGMGELGVSIRFGAAPVRIDGSPGILSVDDTAAGVHQAAAVLLATGREPFTAGLNLEAAGVRQEGARLPVDADQRTNIPHIYAVGDVIDRINLTPVAVDEGRAFADSVFGGKPRRTDLSLVASAVFTQPELASVGLSEEEAKRTLGAEAVRVHRARFRSLALALPQRGPRCLLKLVVEDATDRVLGAHMVGEHSAEIIQMAAIALGMGATKADFDRTMALHPSVAEEFVTMA